MLELHKAIGPDSWVSGGRAIARREAMQDLFFDHPERPEQTDEDWPDDRCLHSEMVITDGDKLVATAMLVVDENRGDCPARIWGMGILPSYRTEFIVQSLEEALLRDGAFEIDQDFIEGADGRLIPNPYVDFEMMLSGSVPSHEA
ncbi:hypothetical protein [Celeribacter sp.]|uniref:hypothetical protein n=1 Tax=Celeribacter sp. TaxID=1890673 RepID=UPI003A8D2695